MGLSFEEQQELLQQIKSIGIIPVIAISDAKKAVPLAKALLRGGIACIEITFRTDEAEESIRRIADEVPEMLITAGTILTIEQLFAAKRAGAKLFISPGFNREIVKVCILNHFLHIPGCSNPTDMEASIELKKTTVKFFPAEQAGGLAYIKACAAVYTKLNFIPTGGINARNLATYLEFDRVIACGGSWIATKEMIDAENFDEITRLSKEAVEIVKSVRSKS